MKLSFNRTQIIETLQNKRDSEKDEKGVVKMIVKES